ncbi:hypothetical protein [uncultured Thiocystis sp.]|jgi:hypothetical protein|uniref:hypothetical protein n=1 Tax=uncultured Thiocystis sp. TaxID=1202134 RepID=UPI0025CF3B7B|nr:hypothetical protein [uncultured Thiocystis sp.]
MKLPQTCTILSTTALVASGLAILMHFVTINGTEQAASAVTAEQAPINGASPLLAGQVAGIAEPSVAVGAENRLEEQSKRIVDLESKIARLDERLRGSGPAGGAPDGRPPPGADPRMLAHIGEQYATRARFEEKRKKLKDRASQMYQRDFDSYGSAAYRELSELYQRARPRRGAQTQDQVADRESALKTLLKDYPEAWSTSVAVAEQALDEAINRNTSGVEGYYQSLVNASPYPEIVTEQGINAIPTLQTYLARQYVEEGRIDDAAAMLDILSAQGDSVILEPDEMGQPTARSAEDIVLELREQILR